jgi:predicted Kef-type K+ transport protein
LTTHEGHVAVGWLIVQDLFAVLALVLLPVLASDRAGTAAAVSEQMRVCIAARQVNPRISIIGIASNAAERAWLEEFGAVLVYDALGEVSEALLAAIRRTV